MFISKEEARSNVLNKILGLTIRDGGYTAEGIRVRKDGSHFWARTFITPMKKRDGSIKFFVLITKDITKERVLEQKREEYIGIASHELKNPITTLSLYSELLAKRLELKRDKKNLHMLRDIQGQAARLVTLVDDLLIVSKIEGGGTLALRTEVFDAKAFIKKITQHFQSISLTHRILYKGTLHAPVRADKERIAQVLINLLTNAVKYSPGAKKVLVRTRREGNKCVISIQDFGPGIAKKDQRDIFTRFFRTDDAGAGSVAGSGLGLYISKAILKRHRERLSVKSIVEKGTTFSFTLSVA